MRVIYRITSIPSTNPSPILQDDKNELNRLCLKSFCHAFSDINPEVIFLADHCTCLDMIEQECIFDYKVIKSNVGINQTMLDSYYLASKVDDYVLFLECDYLFHQKGIGSLYIKAMEQLGIVSPYDNKSFYYRSELHSDVCKIKVIDNHHFRSTERNTMTWGCHSKMIKKNKDILDRYGYLDGEVWYELKHQGYQLWVPIPSFATHMAKDWLAPGINWEEVWHSL